MPACVSAWFWLSWLTSTVCDKHIVKNKVATLDKDKYEEEYEGLWKASPTINMEREQKLK